MKTKKVWAVFMSLVMLIGLIPTAGMMPVVAGEVEEVFTVALPEDSAQNQYTTLEAALNAAKESTATSVKINVTVNTEFPSEINVGKPVTITSDAATIPQVALISACTVVGDVTLDRIDVRPYHEEDQKNTFKQSFVLNGANFTTTANLVSNTAYKKPVKEADKDQTVSPYNTDYVDYQYTSQKISAAILMSGGENTVSLQGGWFSEISFGGLTAVATLLDTNVTIDGNDVKVGDIWFAGRYGVNGATYSGNINLYLKAGAVTGTNQGVMTRGNGVTIASGKAISIIQSSTFSCSNTDIGNLGTANTGSQTNLLAARYWLNLASGIVATAGDTRGEYSVSAKGGNVQATDGTDTYKSDNETLNVAKAGVYSITTVPRTGAVKLWVSSTGDDAAAGTAVAPLKTIAQALADADGADSLTVYVKDSADFPNWSKSYVKGTVTITTADGAEKATLNLKNNVIIRDNLTLDNVNMTPSGNRNYLSVDGIKLHTTSSFSCDYSSNTKGVALAMLADGASSQKSTAILEGGTFAFFSFGSAVAANTATISSAGIEVVLDGATMKDQPYFAGNSKAKQTMQGDIVLRYDSGSWSNMALNTYARTTAEFNLNGHAFVMLRNEDLPNVANFGVVGDSAQTLLNAGKYCYVYCQKSYLTYIAHSAGTAFNVTGGGLVHVYDSSYNQLFIRSRDGKLELPTGEIYRIRFTNQLTANIFAPETTETDAGKAEGVFLGWQDGNGELYQSGDAISSDSIVDPKVTGGVFKPQGASFRGESTYDNEDKRALAMRFVTNVDADMIEAIKDVHASMEYGTIVLPASMLENDDELLTYGRENAAMVKAVNLMSPDENLNYTQIKFNVTLTNIQPKNYKTKYAVRGYIRYVDAQNMKWRTVYTEQHTISAYDLASADGYKDIPFFKDIITAADSYNPAA